MRTLPSTDASRRTRLARGHLPVLDAYRAIAATAVVATHVGFQTGITTHGRFGALLARMDIGVALFFALSGFLLFRQWSTALDQGRPTPDTRGYLWRRGLRILPAYWVVVVAALTLLPDNAGTSPTTWCANLLLLQIYVPQTLTHGLTQMWSLATEVAFYLVLPLLGFVVHRIVRRGPSLLATTCGLAAVMTSVNIGWTALIHQGGAAGLKDFWLPSFLTWFAVGMVLAAMVSQVATGGAGGRVLTSVLALADQPGACWSGALGLLLVASTPLAGPIAFEATPSSGQAVARMLLYASIVALVLLPATLGHPRGRFHAVLASSPLRRLGDISYGIFLWHLVVLATIFRLSDRAPFTGGFLPVFVETLLGAIAVATTSWVVLERPALRLKSRVPM